VTLQSNPYNLSTFLKLNRYEKISIFSQCGNGQLQRHPCCVQESALARQGRDCGRIKEQTERGMNVILTYFHFKQSLVSHTRLHILPEYQADHLRLCRSWMKAHTRALFNEGLESIKKLWLMAGLNSSVHVAELGSWLAFWQKHRHHFTWYCIDELDMSLEEEAFREMAQRSR
jgi:hypothetical protein